MSDGTIVLNNPSGVPQNVRRPVRIGAIKNPEAKVLYIEYGTETNINMYYGYSASAPPNPYQYIPGGWRSAGGSVLGMGTLTGSFAEDFMNGRHEAKVNVAFPDGHASSLPSGPVAADYYTRNSKANNFGPLFRAWNQ